jgi:cytochrome c-type biogenesis protein
MEELLTRWFDSTQVPLLSAVILGLMTAISPCPLATNITAIGFIGKDLGNRNRIFINGLVYTAGRAISYFAIALVLFFGASQFRISAFFQLYGEKIIGPVLLLIGLFMLDFIKLNFSFLNKLTDRYEKRGVRGYWDALLLGILFALAFCPYSGVLYFGILIPMTLGSPSGLLLPVAFAIATGLPVILFAWLLAYSVSGVGLMYKRIKVFETWFRRFIALVFIGVGIYYIIIVYLV